MATNLGSILVELGVDISDLKKGFEEAQKSLQQVGENMTSIGEGLSKAVTLPLAGLGVVALKGASDIESAQGKIQAQLGLTAEEAQKLGDVAKDVWKSGFGENMDEVTEAVTTVKRNIKDLNESDLQKITEEAFILKDAFGAEITDSTKTASTMMKNFGIDAEHAMDLMTVGFQKGGDFSGELLDTMNEYSPMFASMGHSADDMMNILIAGAEAGAFNLDKVGDAVKEFNIRAKDGSDTTAEGFKAIGLNAEEMGAAIAEGGEKGKNAFNATIAALAAMEDPVARNAAGVALFGTQWEDLEANVITAMGTTENLLGEVDGATQKAGDALYDNFGTRLTEALRGLQEALLPLGNVLMDMAERILPVLSSWVETLSNWFSQLSPTMQNIAVIAGIVLAAIGPLLVVIGSIATAVSAAIPVITAIVTAIAGISAPVLIVIGVIAALTAGFIYLWKTNEEFQKGVIEIWTAIKTAGSTIFKALAVIFKTVFNDIKIIVTAVMGALRTFWNQWGNEITTLTKGAFSIIKNTIVTVINIIKNTISMVLAAINGDWKTAHEKYKDISKNAFDWIKSTISTILTTLKSLVGNKFSEIKTAASEKLESMKAAAKEKFESMKSAITTKMSEVKTKIETKWNEAKSFLTNINLFNIGENIIKGLLNGLGSMLGKLKEKAKEIAETVKGAIADKLKIKSPSRIMIGIGENVGEGFAIGMESTHRLIDRASNQLANMAMPNIEKTRSGNVQSSERNSENNIIEVPVYLDSYQIALATNQHISDLQGNQANRRMRWDGVK